MIEETLLRVVIDSNMLESDELHALLSANPGNRAVVTEFAWIEAYKNDALVSINKRLRILAQHPEQVILLKGNSQIAALDPRPPGLARRMARPNGTREFSDTIQALKQALAGDSATLRQVLAHGQRAQEHIEAATSDVSHMLAAMPEMQEQMFTPAEVQACRAGKPFSPAMIAKILGSTEQISEMLYSVHPKKPRQPSRRARMDAFLYRFALATVLYVLRWIGNGSQLGRSHSKVRNDFIDLSFATLVTYFNGLMTDDKNARSLHWELRHVLTMLGARLPPEYIDIFRHQLLR